MLLLVMGSGFMVLSVNFRNIIMLLCNMLIVVVVLGVIPGVLKRK
jgi:hypothetical protein